MEVHDGWTASGIQSTIDLVVLKDVGHGGPPIR